MRPPERDLIDGSVAVPVAAICIPRKEGVGKEKTTSPGSQVSPSSGIIRESKRRGIYEELDLDAMQEKRNPR